ncbi:hypothetical protein [Desulfuromonas acetoxidans]|nr:hypothetical protein [Desulfuromonas acetoxidans]MBF0645280.1 hypothetical protein [Desulfuromonas acetoxidans]NVD25586.1 hypothetical protein [Desulfuromonas acetoxidans]NVE17604.1 hypothetical protein [Desulfuromonas acetoxidans]
MAAHAPYIMTVRHQGSNQVGQVMSCCHSSMKMRWLIAARLTRQWAESGL